MQNFKYRARDLNGKSISGFLAAESESVLAEKLLELNLVLIEAGQAQAEKKGVLLAARVRRRDLILFTNHLASSLEAGITLVTAMSDYAAETVNPRFREVIEDLVRQIVAGTSFSEALSRHPRVFSELYQAIVATGEATGTLEIVLADLVSFLEWQEELSAQIRQASIYPLFLGGMIVAVVTIMMAFTIPRFIPILKGFGVELPTPTRILITVAEFFQYNWLIMVISLFLLVLVQQLTYRSRAGELFWDRLRLRIPLFGKLHQKIVLSQFTHYFSILYRSGIGVLESFTILIRVVGNAAIRAALTRALAKVEKGTSIYDSLRQEELFPPLVLRMVQVGESTGSLDKSLEKASQYYEREVPATIKKIFAAFEPMLIIVMGAAVLFIAMAIFLPIYNLTSTIGGQR